MLKDRRISEQKGIVISDAMVAIAIILLFAGLIITLITNIVFESTKIKINSGQIDVATELLEYVEQLPYESVTQDNLVQYINNKNLENVSAGNTIETVQNESATYKIGIHVETYVPEDESLPKLDLIKIVTVTIENNLLDKDYTTTISRLKQATTQEVSNMIEN